MKRYLYIFVTSVIFICSGCEDFLDENPETFYTTDNAFSTPGQVDQALIAAYSQIRDLVGNPDNTSWIGALRFNGTDMYDVANIRKGNTFNNYGLINPNHGNFYNAYSTFYQLIAKMNLAISAAESPSMVWGDDTEKAYALAQAKFFRAFAYRNLGELFGGVPLVSEVVEVPRYDFKRATRLETYQFAIDDLESSYMNLPETTSSGGRIVKGAALHYLSELYLAKGIQNETEGKTAEAQADYKKAVEYGNTVIDGSVYSLMNERFGVRKNENPVFYYNTKKQLSYEDVIGVTNGNVFWDLFQEGNVNYQDGNKECIWALQIDYNAYKAEDKKSRLPYAGFYGPVFRDGANNKHIGGMLEDVGGRGVSFLMPTMYTRDVIYEGKWEQDMRNSEAVFRRKFVGNIESSPYYGKVVPWSEMYANENSKSLTYPISCKISTDKFTGLEDGENRSNLFRDEYIIRLPETILLRAEAKMRMGDKSGAAADINLLRDRAQCDYRVVASDVNVDLILDERARELVYEEWRWNTLLRMGGTVATDRIKKHAYWPEAKATLNFDFNLWPIPQTVIDTNKDVVIEQNSGWENR
ncbi:RagB/SusD family nutrient uptake outer membrane protein [Parabacteroides johnsonii]|uniref:RagB/SusD family nutrient uptake outer membrane protein n=2 Tax=Parabacteroides johnsonii TaxID=387661 RepID=UPI00189BF586|nr:RagB/SusD family nutrient uptake outer membrane protein [Parabacteroides johnsonii]